MYNDYYSAYSTESLVDTTAASTALTGMFFGIMIFSLILSLISIISYWKIFNKAGKPGWASIIPIYNYVVMIQIAKLSLVYLVLLIVPIANIYALFKINIEMAKKFGKSAGFGVGMTLIPIIFMPLLAFSDNNYEDNVVENNTTNTSFDATTVVNNNEVNDVNLNTENELNNIETNIPKENISENIVNNEPVSMNEIPIMDNGNNEVNYVESNNIVEPQTVETNNIVEPQIDTSNSVPNELGGNEVNNVPNAFNQTPIMDENTIVNEPKNEVPVNPVPDIPLNDSVVPEINIPVEPQVIPTPENPVQPETLQVEEPIKIEEVSTVNPLENDNGKKYCKSCGNEMPNIVSICPNCGTDNE